MIVFLMAISNPAVAGSGVSKELGDCAVSPWDISILQDRFPPNFNETIMAG